MSDASVQTSTAIGGLPGTPYTSPEFYRPPLLYPAIPFHEMLARTAWRVPECPAIYWRDVTLTYRELYALVRLTAVGLQALGLGKGDRLCVLMANRPEYLIAWMAASMLGVVVSPMNPSYKEREVSYQLENAEANAIVVQRELLPLVQAARGQAPQLRHVLVTGSEPVADDSGVVPFGLLMRSHPPKSVQPVKIDGDDLLALPYSSRTPASLTTRQRSALRPLGNVSCNSCAAK